MGFEGHAQDFGVPRVVLLYERKALEQDACPR